MNLWLQKYLHVWHKSVAEKYESYFVFMNHKHKLIILEVSFRILSIMVVSSGTYLDVGKK